MILAAIVASTLIWANLTSGYVWVVLLVTLGFGAIGFYDDYLKVTKQSHKGFSGKARLGARDRDCGHCRLCHHCANWHRALCNVADVSILERPDC